MMVAIICKTCLIVDHFSFILNTNFTNLTNKITNTAERRLDDQAAFMPVYWTCFSVTADWVGIASPRNLSSFHFPPSSFHYELGIA